MQPQTKIIFAFTLDNLIEFEYGSSYTNTLSQLKEIYFR